MPSDLIEELLVGCGRPILLASLTPPRDFTGTIMVCWRQTADAARAVAATALFLVKAKRVVFVGVAEHKDVITDAVSDLAAQFKWHGVATDVQIVAQSGRPISDVLSSTAEACYQHFRYKREWIARSDDPTALHNVPTQNDGFGSMLLKKSAAYRWRAINESKALIS